ncbi:BrnT family toxin [Sphaerothrix gracilis]|uniref:BrnT family toxin n=1 Tax=Sphaerothrix gracilis TaxID=3151835 RepID=UPI0031FBA3F9
MRYRFDWAPAKDASNFQKHRISFRQAATVFRDPRQVSIYDAEHSQDEDRWITLGVDSSGVVRVVVHTFEQMSQEVCHIRIISARKATRAEILQYQGAEE